MRNRLYLATIVMVLAAGMSAQQSHAQMNTVFDRVFNGILIDKLVLSSGSHANHFIPAAEEASATLTPALNRMIVQNISSLPLSSTIAGTVYEEKDGEFIETRTSWGPIFAETGATLGKGAFNVGINYTGAKFDQFRGLKTEDIEFSFVHQDTDGPPLGSTPSESDVIDVVMDLQIDSSVFALTGTYGLLSNLDVGLAIPIVQLKVKGDAQATINSYTHPSTGSALHIFGGTTTNPLLTTTQSYSESSSGIGDIAVRAKYSLKQTRKEQYGVLLDLRLPTGSEDDFLGSGELNMNLMGIYSRTYGLFTPHLNLAYGYRGAESIGDEIDFAVGFDQGINAKFSLAVDILGLMPLDSEKTVSIAPGSTTIEDNPPLGGSTTRQISHSNVADYGRDNIVDASLGFRYAPANSAIVQANVLIPMNDGGLRSGLSFTLGLTMYR